MIMNLLLVEDHPIFRIGVRQLVQQHWPTATIREAGTLAEAMEAVHERFFDLAVVDLNLPDTSGIEALSQMRRMAPATKVLVLSLNSEAAYAQRSLQLGASGYLTKDRAASELVAALERILAGGRYISQTLAEQLADQVSGLRKAVPHEELSVQEYRVLVQLAQGRSVGDVALSMRLSPKTVSTYRSRVLRKLLLGSNLELTRHCQTHRLIDVA
jgi:DNA-binding NarL/FixJ family response regulator